MGEGVILHPCLMIFFHFSQLVKNSPRNSANIHRYYPSTFRVIFIPESNLARSRRLLIGRPGEVAMDWVRVRTHQHSFTPHIFGHFGPLMTSLWRSDPAWSCGLIIFKSGKHIYIPMTTYFSSFREADFIWYHMKALILKKMKSIDPSDKICWRQLFFWRHESP